MTEIKQTHVSSSKPEKNKYLHKTEAYKLYSEVFFEYYCQISSKLIHTVSSYTVSNLGRFFETQCIIVIAYLLIYLLTAVAAQASLKQQQKTFRGFTLFMAKETLCRSKTVSSVFSRKSSLLA